MHSFDSQPIASTEDLVPRLPALRWNDVVVVEVKLDIPEVGRHRLESILNAEERGLALTLFR